MNDMQNMERQLKEKLRQQEVYENAMAKLAYKKQLREGEGLTLMFAWDAFGEEVRGDTLLSKAGKASAFFCIGFAFLAPSLLLIRNVLMAG